MGAIARVSLGAALVLGCAGEDAEPPPQSTDTCPDDLPSRDRCPDGAPSYAREVSQVIAQRCVSCHYRGNTQSSQVFEELGEIQAARTTMLTLAYRCEMPPPAGMPLSAAERAALLTWLVCGAPDN